MNSSSPATLDWHLTEEETYQMITVFVMFCVTLWAQKQARLFAAAADFKDLPRNNHCSRKLFAPKMRLRFQYINTESTRFLSAALHAIMLDRAFQVISSRQ
jgi:hypothetical protein